MLKILKNIKDISNSNLVYFIEKERDIEKIQFLNLNENILNKINKIIKKEKSIMEDFFIGDYNIEKIFILFYFKKDKKDLLYFLGEHFPELPNNITILSNNDKNILTLLDSCLLSRYKFQNYKTEKKKDEIFIITDDLNKKKIETRVETIKNIILSRDLAETPANDLTPETFVKIIEKTNFKNTKVRILTQEDIKKEGLNLLWAVGKGSINKPYMVILERIIDKKAPTYGFIGKGLVFDTGGIQVKPDTSMYEMKGDMCGAATAFAIASELDDKKLDINIITCLVLAENHISGESFKPSDIFTSYSGKTVDIGHTDAEGRLVLADGISYISKNYKTDHIISIATLTGAVVAALGYRHAGIMGTNDDLIEKLLDYSKDNFEMYSRLPFDNYFVEKTKSDIADLSNINRIMKAGSTMGAAFLYNFLMNNETYTHIDIAGTAMNEMESYGLNPKGMTGFGVDSLSYIFRKLK